MPRRRVRRVSYRGSRIQSYRPRGVYGRTLWGYALMIALLIAPAVLFSRTEENGSMRENGPEGFDSDRGSAATELPVIIEAPLTLPAANPSPDPLASKVVPTPAPTVLPAKAEVRSTVTHARVTPRIERAPAVAGKVESKSAAPRVEKGSAVAVKLETGETPRVEKAPSVAKKAETKRSVTPSTRSQADQVGRAISKAHAPSNGNKSADLKASRFSTSRRAKSSRIEADPPPLRRPM